MEFEWDENKNRDNIEKHGVSFFDAQDAFLTVKESLPLMLSIQRKLRKGISVSGWSGKE